MRVPDASSGGIIGVFIKNETVDMKVSYNAEDIT